MGRKKKEILSGEAQVSVKENIVGKDLSNVMSDEFMRYTYAVIEDRALPDARDGLKPSQRRILVAMDDLNLKPSGSTEKSAKICGDTSGNYHPHGEAIVYPTMTRLAQDWVLRYPLVHPQGNFGSPDPDSSPAAMRYTEAKLSKYGELMLADLSSDVVPYIPNYNEKKIEPTVLPAAMPNLLLNGGSGIAVGVATKMPTHNLRELVGVITAFIKNENITVEEIIKLMPGPDFPTGGVLLGQDGVRSYYSTGRGALKIEGVYTIELGDKGTNKIFVSELPYGASPEQLLTQVKQLVEDKRIEGITDMKDMSHRSKGELVFKVMIETGKNVNVNLVLNKILKHTCLRTSFNVNQTVLIDGVVKENATIYDLLKAFVDHRRLVLTNKFTAELGKAKARVHILDGLINITKSIRKVVELITESDSPEDAQNQLIEKGYVDTEEQAKAVLSITLRQLTKLEANALVDEQNKLNARILWLDGVLTDNKKLSKIIIQEQENIAKTLGDDRRTQIGHSADDLSAEDLILEEQIMISLTKDGYIKRMSMDSSKLQNRGGKGVIGASKREDDEMNDLYVASTHEILLFFTNKGLVYKKKGYDIPLGARTSKGMHMANILALNADEYVTNMIPVKTMNHDQNLVLITKNGMIKRTKLLDYDTSLKTRGLPAIKLLPEDSLVFAELTDGNRDIFIVTENGKAIRYPETTVRLTGRFTNGVKALNLINNDSIAQMLVIDSEENPDILVVTSLGFGKRTESSKYRCLRGRFAKGVDTIDKVKIDRNGIIVGACTVNNDDSIIILTVEGKIIQIPVEDIRSVNRTAMGVKMLKLDTQDNVRSVTKIKNGSLVAEDEEE